MDCEWICDSIYQSVYEWIYQSVYEWIYESIYDGSPPGGGGRGEGGRRREEVNKEPMFGCFDMCLRIYYPSTNPTTYYHLTA